MSPTGMGSAVVRVTALPGVWLTSTAYGNAGVVGSCGNGQGWGVGVGGGQGQVVPSRARTHCHRRTGHTEGSSNAWGIARATRLVFMAHPSVHIWHNGVWLLE